MKCKTKILVTVFFIGCLFGMVVGVAIDSQGQHLVSVFKAITEIILPWGALFIAYYGLSSWKNSHVHTEKYNVVRKLYEQMQSLTGKAKEFCFYNRMVQRNTYPRATVYRAKLSEDLTRVEYEFAIELHKYKEVLKELELFEIEGDFSFPHDNFIKLYCGIVEVYSKNGMLNISELEGDLALIDASIDKLLASFEDSVRTLKSSYFRI
ncbi:hypothetical protein LPR20_003682 [Vibrio mimicus]